MDDGLERRLADIRGRIEKACRGAGRAAGAVRLIAVTKNHPAETLQRLIDLGVRDIGENRVQEIEEKAPRLRGDFTLHMIGHLQTNKAQKVWPLAGWIQSVDREKLVSRLEFLHNAETCRGGNLPPAVSGDIPPNVAVNVCRGDDNLTPGSLYDGNCRGDRPRSPAVSGKKNVLVEVNTSGEESKSGCAPNECRQLCDLVMQSKALELRGLMTIGPLNGGERAVRNAFSLLRELSQKCCTGIKAPELSMGMSGDFEWAIEEGATMVRIGTVLVGERA